jgi:microcystin-dependent protein
MTSYIRSFAELTAHQRATVGDTKTSVITDDHMGWLLCDGRTLKTKEFYFLFQIIGYSFGGSGGVFHLPKPSGTVPGIVGTGRDANMNTYAFSLGQQRGEYTHQLTIPEIPSHNHGVAGTLVTDQISSNTSTSIAYTGIYDSGHTHGYTATNDTNHDNAVSLTNSANNQGTRAATTNIGNANLVDPGHAHVLHSAGGDQYHNNIQPTLPVGNMFIYSGKVNEGNFPNIKSIYSY